MRALGLLLAVVCVTGCEGPAGPPGEMGEQGEQGPQGPAGMDGTDGVDGVDGAGGFSVVATTSCAGSVTQGGVFAFGMRYAIIEYSNGDVWTTCELRDTEGTFSSSSYYDAAQVGAGTHYCSVAREDAPVPGAYGFWMFELGSVGYEVTYDNPASTNDGFVFSFDGPSSLDNGCTTLVR